VARKFVYLVAGAIVLVLLGAIALRLFGTQLSQIAFVPKEEFVAQPALQPSIYDQSDMWIAKPDMTSNPALWQPAMDDPGPETQIPVFFIHPTSYLEPRAHWNAPLDNSEANWRARLFVQGMASAFNATTQIWAPRYRQAAFGAFLTDKKEAKQAIDLAYGDVLQAFDKFVAEQDPRAPIILAGHSQGALHLTRLLKDRVAGKPLAKRIVAAYVIGWPISVTADLPALGLPACANPEQPNCILSWQSFAEPADYKQIVAAFEAAPSLTGKPRKGSTLVCTNPLTGTAGGKAPASANLGTLKNNADFTDGELVPQSVGARCDAKGFLLIGDPPSLGPFVLPGNNYHVYDYSLFWRNIRADAVRRTGAFR
jgi:Protein of unknown function (DUF3089)